MAEEEGTYKIYNVSARMYVVQASAVSASFKGLVTTFSLTVPKDKPVALGKGDASTAVAFRLQDAGDDAFIVRHFQPVSR